MAHRSGNARRALAFVLAAAVASPSTSALAQATPQADSLFSEGRDLLEKGKFVEACAKLAKSEELSPAVGTLLNLGYCYEQIGRLRSAMDAYSEAEALAAGAADTKRATFAKDRFAAVEPRAPKLVVRITPPEAPGLEIKRNGVVIPKTDFDRPIAVDPQDYVIGASAPGRAAWKSAIIVRGEGAVVTMIVPPLENAIGPSAAHGQAGALSTRQIVALGLGGVGALAIGGGIAAAFAANSRYDDSSSHCAGGACDEVGASIQSGAVAQGNVATVLIGLGLLATAAGVYLWIVNPESKPSRSAAHPSLGGRF